MPTPCSIASRGLRGTGRSGHDTALDAARAERDGTVVGVTAACDASHGEFTALYVPIEGIAFTADLGSPGLACDAPPGGAN